MNPNLRLVEIAEDEFEVWLKSTYVGIVWLGDHAGWEAQDVRDKEPNNWTFDTVEEAANWLVGY